MATSKSSPQQRANKVFDRINALTDVNAALSQAIALVQIHA